MKALYSETRKVTLILNSIQAKLDKLLLEEAQKTEQGLNEERPNNRILKEYNGEPNISSSITLTPFELELEQRTVQQIVEQVLRISTTLEFIEQEQYKKHN